MQQFNYPTTIFYGEDCLQPLASAIKKSGYHKPLVVTDKTLVKLGLVSKLEGPFGIEGLKLTIFSETHTNPLEEDVERGILVYKDHDCDCLVALGGGSPIDVAKVIMLRVNHEGPLEPYDDALGGDRLIVNDMPPLYAIPTTAGTGSEVGRSGVVTLASTNTKTIFFHPDMLPKIAVLDPSFTIGLPPDLTVATGLDALTHNLEAFMAPGFHPMADGIALEGLRIVLSELPKVYKDGANVQARAKMLIAATMGATAFQKGLGMIHSMAHPLSTECGMHHGLANALCLPGCIEFIESSQLNSGQLKQIQRVKYIFNEYGYNQDTLALQCSSFFKSLGLQFGLKNHGVSEDQLGPLSQKAFKDPCHQTNMVPVTEEQFLKTFKRVFK